MTIPSYLNGLCPLSVHVISYRREFLCLNAVFFLPEEHPAWHPLNWVHRKFLRNLHSANQDNWCCPLEQNGHNSWKTGQVLTWESAEHGEFKSQKPEAQGRKNCSSVPHCASLLWNCECRIPETRNTSSWFLLQETEVFNCWKSVHSTPRTRNSSIKLSTRKTLFFLSKSSKSLEAGRHARIK